ncbi:TGS domain-containing protein, partial [Klebsiella pneumoniae]|uniref:TGS domain-containing protein n=1 Tax=Klebsiella pneumoniae TaxID=573 RepID=UPI001D0E8EA6
MSEALITESEPLTFTLPDGSLKLVRKGTTLQNVAESIDSSVAKNAVYAEIDGQYIDLIEAVQKSGTLNIIGTVAKLAMRQPFVLFKGLTFQKLCLPGAFR